jgi:hypothetical protein
MACTPSTPTVITDWTDLDAGIEFDEDENTLTRTIPFDSGTVKAKSVQRIAPGYCFDVQWEATELKHIQNVFVYIEDEAGNASSRNGWYLTQVVGSVPFVGTLLDNVQGMAVSGDGFPLGLRITGEADGTGEIRLAVGGIAMGWGLGTGITFNPNSSHRVVVAIGNEEDDDPYGESPVVLLGRGREVSPGDRDYCGAIEHLLV